METAEVWVNGLICRHASILALARQYADTGFSVSALISYPT